MGKSAKPKLKPGECIWCRVESPEPGGYRVSVVPGPLKGFLPSTHPIEIGKVVPTTFVCMDGEQALFTFAFTMGTSSRVQHSTASDAENAFSVWAEAHPKYISLRRAVDVIMPPLQNAPMMVKLDKQRALEFIPSLEETSFTGCTKIYCQSSLSRAALIFYAGRVVGSIYTKKPNRDPYPFEIGIKKLMEDLSQDDTDAEMEMYELPKEIILSMSALFLGYVDQTKSDSNEFAYCKSMLHHFSDHKETSCLNLLDEETDTPMALSFVYQGSFYGSYLVSERIFSDSDEFWLSLFSKFPEAKLHAHILPKALTSESVLYGYSLNSEQFTIRPKLEENSESSEEAPGP